MGKEEMFTSHAAREEVHLTGEHHFRLLVLCFAAAKKHFLGQALEARKEMFVSLSGESVFDRVRFLCYKYWVILQRRSTHKRGRRAGRRVCPNETAKPGRGEEGQGSISSKEGTFITRIEKHF